MLVSDRVLGTVIFSLPVSQGVAAGGSILWDDVFWFFGHPEVYVVLLPGFGMISEILPVFSGRPLAERNIILAVTGAVIVPLSYLVWEHHMFITGVSLTRGRGLQRRDATDLPAVRRDHPRVRQVARQVVDQALGPDAIRASARSSSSSSAGSRGSSSRPSCSTSSSGARTSSSRTSTTSWSGPRSSRSSAGIYFYLPKMTGRMYHEGMAKAHFIISFIGFNVLYFPMFFLYDMPRRIYTYQSIPTWNTLNLISTVGAFIFALAQILLVAQPRLHAEERKIAPANPGAPPARVDPDHHGRLRRPRRGPARSWDTTQATTRATTRAATRSTTARGPSSSPAGWRSPSSASASSPTIRRPAS